MKDLPCKEGEPVFVDDRANPEEPFFFMYATAFKRLKLCLPFTGFERALLTEVNVTPAQLHPNSWAFVRAFAILCNHFGHTSFVDVFFQRSYKGFKGKFFKICYNKHDSTLLDGFPLYWVEKARLKKLMSLEDLAPPNRKVCQFLSSLGVVFNTAELIKLEYNPKPLKAYIGTLSDSCWFMFLCIVVFLCRHGVKRGEEEDAS